MAQGFANQLTESGLIGNVYYPARPDDKADLTLNSKFDVVFESNGGSNMVKAFLTGFTFFILEPVFWYDFDYKLQAKVDVVQDNVKVDTLHAHTDARMSAKFLSLSDAQVLEGQTLKEAKQSLFRQIMQKLRDRHSLE